MIRLFLFFDLFALTFSLIPIAPYQVFHVDPGSYVIIPLPGYDPDGDPITITIRSLPETGSLYQVSDIYDKYGYNPSYDSTGVITTVPTVLKKQTVIYVRPTSDYYPENGQYTEFTYTVNDGIDDSLLGIILLSYDQITMQSTFDIDIDGWSVRNNGDTDLPVVYDRTRRGELAFYVYSEENLIQRDITTGNDMELWYFQAPSKFLGNHWEAYNGQLQFTLAAAAGNFQPNNLNGKLALVILECATCNNHHGIRLAYFLDGTTMERSFDGTSKTFTIQLDESTVGWYKDPSNSNLQWPSPTQCEFINVLSSLSNILILGDFTKDYEAIGLDNVKLLHYKSRKKLNLDCYSQ